MKITNQTSQVVTVNLEDYLELLRDKFSIIHAVNGTDELQALSEAVNIKSQTLMYDCDMNNIDTRLCVSADLMTLYNQAANYAQLLNAKEFESTKVKA